MFGFEGLSVKMNISKEKKRQKKTYAQHDSYLNKKDSKKQLYLPRLLF